jgi:G3E family GTPase
MKILLFGGFLGSGKTSVLLHLLAKLPKRSTMEKAVDVVLLENEIGEVGIDGAVLSQSGAAVKEILSGCICCTLSSDLVSGVIEIKNTYDPQWLVIETTGMAYPGKAADTIRKYMPDAETAAGAQVGGSSPPDIVIVTLVDAKRWEELFEILEPLMKGQLLNADVILLNKKDLVSDGERERITGQLRLINPAAEIIPICALEGLEDGILERIIGGF